LVHRFPGKPSFPQQAAAGPARSRLIGGFETIELVRDVISLAWQFRADCVWSVVLSLVCCCSASRAQVAGAGD
jgi:hypothetical protein